MGVMPYTCNDLTLDLRNLGVASGDILFVHSSFKALGPVQGDAGTVVQALDNSISAQGLLLLPSFNLAEREKDKRAETWDLDKTPSTVGWITEYCRQLPDTYRSDHYSASIAARGQRAKVFVAGHLSQEGYESPWDRQPWGKTYGFHSPMYKAYQANAKILMLGVDYVSSTYIHFVEVLYWHRLRARDQTVTYPALKRPELGAFWDQVGELGRGLVGDAACRLFSIKKYVDTLLAEVERNAHLYLRSR
jgi:aminoglycoside 3-N-acetyltransferase